MRFVAPAWLWLLLALPALYVLVLRDEKRRQALFERFASRALWRALVPELDLGALDGLPVVVGDRTRDGAGGDTLGRERRGADQQPEQGGGQRRQTQTCE